jgi:hypothetical protein
MFLWNVAYGLQYLKCIKLSDDNADHTPVLPEQRATAIARLHRRSNLNFSTIIP